MTNSNENILEPDNLLMTEDQEPVRRIPISSTDLDNITALVYHKLNNKIKQKSNNKNSKQIKPAIKIIIQIIGLILTIIFFFMLIKNTPKYSNEIKEDSYKFNFISAKDFENSEYYTKEDLLTYIVSYITKIIYEIDNTDESELSKKLNSTQKSFLFKGPPGTGKTHFIKKLAFSLDINLQLYKLEKEIGKSNFESIKFKDKFRLIRKKDPVVHVLFLSPSIIENKYVGESEKIIKSIFEQASKLENSQATIIFFDEMDAFFGTRKDSQENHETKKQTEFLNLIGGASDNVDTKLFLFGATNRIEALDKAFLRRFFNKFLFDIPTQEEFKILLTQHTSNWIQSPIRNSIINIITDKHGTKGLSHSEIIEIISKIALISDIKIDESYNILSIEFDNFVNDKTGIKNSKLILPSSLEKHVYYNSISDSSE